jgi:(2Fe-2S) ferredoxin
MNEALYRANVVLCGGTGCEASGSSATFRAMEDEIRRRGLDSEVRMVHTGCRGFCAMGPVMVVYPEGIFYCQVHADDVPELVEETLVKGRVVERLAYKEPHTHQPIPSYGDIPFYSKQLRVTLRNCGIIDPENIEEYIALDGYQALAQVLSSMAPQDVYEEVKLSRLRGRGGAGFLTGLKWEFTARAQSDVKYVVCNADEGDPGAFMDRSIIEGDPHSLLEGMAICAYAVGAREGYIYCRAEYPLAIKRLKIAIGQAQERGLLGDNILGGGRRLCLRRGDRASGLHRGSPGRATPPPALPRRRRPVGQADHPEQRQELCQRPADHPQGGRLVCQHRPVSIARHGHLCPHRPGEQHRPGRSADGHHAGRDHL